MRLCLQKFFGTAVGKGRQAAKTEIERLKLGELSSEQGVVEVAKMCVCYPFQEAMLHNLVEERHLVVKCSGICPDSCMKQSEILCVSCSLYSVHDEEKPFELEMAWICDASDREFRRVPADILEAAEQQAKASLEESDMCV